MTANRRTAASVARSFLSFVVIATFALWVNEAQALSSGGGGGSNGGGSNGGGGNSGGAPGGPGGRDGRDGISNGRYDTVTRARSADEIVAPVGFVISDDICTGGKYEKC